MVLRDEPLLDPNDGMALRVYLEAMRSQLANEYGSWLNHYQELAAYFAPRQPQWNFQEANLGWRRDGVIMNATGILDLRILKAGMLTGLSNPASRWFNLVAGDPKLDALPSVRRYLEDVEDALLRIFAKSNFYDTLLQAYGDEGLYGTTAFFIEEDPVTDIRCHPCPIGSYYISGGPDLRVDLLLRQIPMTIREIVDRFGYDQCSSATRVLYDSNAGGVKEQWRTVIHVITKNTFYSLSKPMGQKPWISVYYELDTYDGPGKPPSGKPKETAGILRRSGYYECPFIVGRWLTYGENFYGESPAMDILGDNMGLQAYEEKIALGVDRQVDPTMLAGPELDGRKLSSQPGDIVFAENKNGEATFRPAYEIKFEIEGAFKMKMQNEERIHQGLFRDIFQAISNSSPTQPRTAEEIRALREEQMAQIGPVVERNTGDVHAPSIIRTLGIAHRRGKLPPMPPELRNQPIRMEFESILVKAAKLSQASGIDRMVAFCGNEAALQQGTMDLVNWDQATRKYGDLVGVPNALMRTPEEVKKMRDQRAYQQQQAQQADNAQKLALAAKNAAGADTSQPSALTQAVPALKS